MSTDHLAILNLSPGDRNPQYSSELKNERNPFIRNSQRFTWNLKPNELKEISNSIISNKYKQNHYYQFSTDFVSNT
jgi:hypothetical protein